MPLLRSRFAGAILAILLLGCGSAPPAKAPATVKIDEGAHSSHGPAKEAGADPEIQSGASEKKEGQKGRVSLATVVAEQPKTLDDEIDEKMAQLIAEAEAPPPEQVEDEEPVRPKPKPKKKKKKPKAKK